MCRFGFAIVTTDGVLLSILIQVWLACIGDRSLDLPIPPKRSYPPQGPKFLRLSAAADLALALLLRFKH